MIRLTTILFALSLHALAGAVHAAESGAPNSGYWKRSAEGWFWYEDPPPLPEKKPKEEKKPAAATPSTPAEDPSDPLVQLKKIQEEISRMEARAVLNPTEDNVRNYLVANQWQLNQSSTFSDVWRRVVWQTPDLDYSLRRPTTNVAVHSYQDQRKDAKAEAVASVSKTHGLFFFFRGSCPYCHTFAPILRQFSERYGIEVLPISLDGGVLPDFPEPRVDTRVANDLGVEAVPSVFLVDPKRRDVIPVGAGVMSMDELAERIYVLTQTAPGQDY